MVAPKALAVRWLLLCTLAFGVVGMHHLASTSHHGSEHTGLKSGVESHVAPTITQAVASNNCCDDHTPTGTHDLLHLCLAVLAAGLVLGGLLAHRRRSGPGTRLAPVLRQRPPHRPSGSTAVLVPLGVLRL
jgi:hypothetical protein